MNPRNWTLAATLLSGCITINGKVEPPPDGPQPHPAEPPMTVVDAIGDATFRADVTAWTQPAPQPQQFPPLFADIAIGNATAQEIVVRVRPLKPTVQLDCKLAMQAPGAWLSRTLFAPARTWVVAGGRAFAPKVAGEGPKGVGCTALLVDGGGLPMRLLFWRNDDYPPAKMPSTVQGEVVGRLVRLDGTGNELVWPKHPVVFSAPAQVSPGMPEGCNQPSEIEGLAWSQPVPQGDQTVVDVLSAPNGCHQIELLGKTGISTWTLCVPVGTMPFEPGDEFFASPLQGGHNLKPITGFDLIGDGKRIRFGRGQDVVYAGAVDIGVHQQAGCAARHDACGSSLANLEFEILAKGANKKAVVGGGGVVDVGPNAQLHVVRAFHAPIADIACTGGLVQAQLVESVFVQGVTP